MYNGNILVFFCVNLGHTKMVGFMIYVETSVDFLSLAFVNSFQPQKYVMSILFKPEINAIYSRSVPI